MHWLIRRSCALLSLMKLRSLLTAVAEGTRMFGQHSSTCRFKYEDFPSLFLSFPKFNQEWLFIFMFTSVGRCSWLLDQQGIFFLL